MLELRFPPGEHAAALEQAEAFLAGRGIGAAQLYRARLVLDELLANLAMHGRFPPGPPPPVRLEVAAAGDAVELALEDGAEPFDPRAAPTPAAPSLDDDRVGGLGLALVRRMAEIRDYRRLPGGRNRIELVIAAGPG